jgi:hypothetical protein
MVYRRCPGLFSCMLWTEVTIKLNLGIRFLVEDLGAYLLLFFVWGILILFREEVENTILAFGIQSIGALSFDVEQRLNNLL